MNKKTVIAFGLIMLMFSSASHALIITTANESYHIQLASVETDSDLLATLMEQDWWGDRELAARLAEASVTEFGYVNNPRILGLLFAVEPFSSTAVRATTFINLTSSCAPEIAPCVFTGIYNLEGASSEMFYAVGKPVPVPAAVWLFVSGLLGLRLICSKSK